MPNNQQTKQTKQKINNSGAEAREKGDRRSGTQEGKNDGSEWVKHCTKTTEHQVNCLAQKVKDKGRRGGNKGHLSSHMCDAHKDGG